ncbi:DUF2953 domain-containing protein [Bacillus sp. RAR_GA_16]|uniref:DUF2953 domain-containing protein n=1 Tax=Bacillus sp. RAR_GA_16 TaxID=2876774 RepID=UPI001CCEE6CE|nr:DUF2953 domain-containing protein [Bacillus sp. RAR_GA_16]MCA0171570.1 DUF2953 domain-containing protein [Bacillus sp. RAR_GA_16]
MIIAIAAILLLLIIASLPLIVFSTVRVTVIMEHSSMVEELQIAVRALFGLVVYETTIPLIELFEDGEEAIEKKEKEKGFKGGGKELIQVIKKAFRARKSFLFFLKKVRFKTIQWETNFGMGNAANTAVIAELVLNTKVAIFTLLSHYSNLHTIPQLIVTPIYEMKSIQTYMRCMITFKLGHAMIAVIKLMKSQRKVQEA